MSSNGGPIEAAIFDYGGVLTTPGRQAIAEWTRAENIRPETFSAALKDWLSRDAPAGTPIHQLETGELAAEDFNRALAERLRTEDGAPVVASGLVSRLFAHMRPEPRMHDLVRRVRSAGIRTALLSNSWGNDYPWDEIDGLFDVVVISAEFGLRKPDPRIFRLTLDDLGTTGRNTVFIDDGPPNVEAAEMLELHAILHKEPETTYDQLTTLIPGVRHPQH